MQTLERVGQMTKIQKDYRNWIVWMALVVSLSLIPWLLFTIKDNIFQPKVFLILLLYFITHDLIKRVPTPEQQIQNLRNRKVRI